MLNFYQRIYEQIVFVFVDYLYQEVTDLTNEVKKLKEILIEKQTELKRCEHDIKYIQDNIDKTRKNFEATKEESEECIAQLQSLKSGLYLFSYLDHEF